MGWSSVRLERKESISSFQSLPPLPHCVHIKYCLLYGVLVERYLGQRVLLALCSDGGTLPETQRARLVCVVPVKRCSTEHVLLAMESAGGTLPDTTCAGAMQVKALLDTICVSTCASVVLVMKMMISNACCCAPQDNITLACTCTCML